MFSIFLKSFNLRPKNVQFFIAGVIFFLSFITLVILESFRALGKIDLTVTTELQKIIPRFFDTPLSFFSILGSLELTTTFLVILGLIIFYNRKIVLPSLGIFGVVMVFELIGKLLIFHPGPPRIFLRYDLPFSTPEYLSNTYSFPSGHVGRTTFLSVVAAVLIIRLIKNKSGRVFLLTLLMIFLLTMAVSRIYLGEHWSSDVLGGLLLGSAMGFFAMVYYE